MEKGILLNLFRSGPQPTNAFGSIGGGKLPARCPTRCAVVSVLALAAVIALLLCVSQPLPAQSQSPGNLSATVAVHPLYPSQYCITVTWTSMTAATKGYDVWARAMTADFSTFYQRNTWHIFQTTASHLANTPFLLQPHSKRRDRLYRNGARQRADP